MNNRNQTQQTLPSAKMSKPRCLLCNSASHEHEQCNSNMNGRRDLLRTLAETMMMEDTMPDFKSFAINELRYIAFHYMQSMMFTRRVPKGQYQVHLDPMRVKHFRSPIPLTLTKTRMVKDLTARWVYIADIREKKRTIPEEDNCPICMECMLMPVWNAYTLAWDTKDMLPSRIITKCKHSFCGDCWGLHIGASAKREYIDHIHEGNWTVKCPLCRTNMVFTNEKYQSEIRRILPPGFPDWE